jgi:hypothetical protein
MVTSRNAGAALCHQILTERARRSEKFHHRLKAVYGDKAMK